MSKQWRNITKPFQYKGNRWKVKRENIRGPPSLNQKHNQSYPPREREGGDWGTANRDRDDQQPSLSAIHSLRPQEAILMCTPLHYIGFSLKITQDLRISTKTYARNATIISIIRTNSLKYFIVWFTIQTTLKNRY